MLYYSEPYRKELEARIIKKDGKRYLLDKTILYEGGGGQPPDRGFFVCDGKRGKIKHLGNLWHEVSEDICEDRIKIYLDWDFRYHMMKNHTGEHTFFRFLQNKGAKLVKISLGEESSIIFEGDISIDDIIESEKMTRELIKKGKNVRTFWIEKSDVKNYPQLRINIDRIKGDKIRVVEIENHDISACRGIHVKNLSEIGDFIVVKFRRGKIKEVKFRIGEEASNFIYENSVIGRKVSWENNVDIDKFDKFVENLKKENEKMYQSLKNISEELEFHKEECKDIEVYWRIFNYGNNKVLVRRAMEIVNKEGKIVIYGNMGEKNMVSCAYPHKCSWIRDVFMALLSEMGGKGGGKGNFVSGSVYNVEDFVNNLKRIICDNAMHNR